ncbi:MAG: hypothetical protein J6Q54_06915 [Oscillospiraceae bacterium]|nr:hypothetical protein [Oscillospiraceae bacterium]
MKKTIILAIIIALACTVTACGCQMSSNMDNTTGTSNSTTKPMVDPTILEPTFETNIPDENVNENSTDPFGTIPDTTGDTNESTIITEPPIGRSKRILK